MPKSDLFIRHILVPHPSGSLRLCKMAILPFSLFPFPFSLTSSCNSFNFKNTSANFIYACRSCARL